jgi:cysteine desulfurase/selenocysteine lyase
MREGDARLVACQIEATIEADFPFLRGAAYFDSASVCPLPRPSAEVMTEYYATRPLNYGVGKFRLAEEVAAAVEDSRGEIADFIGATPGEVVFTKNTTEAINLVARGVRWAPGDEVILSSLEHQSNIIPWLRLQHEAGLKVLVAPHGRTGLVEPEQVVSLLSSRTRLVAMTHVSNVLGTIQPVTTIVEEARGRGALTLVDAAQSAGRVTVNVQEVGADFVAFCGRKALMGPQGTGFLYGRAGHLRELTPLMTGSRSGRVVEGSRYEELPVPFRFEAGVLNTAGVLGLAASVRYLKALGSPLRTERTRRMGQLLYGELKQVGQRVIIHSPAEESVQVGIFSFSVTGAEPHAVARALDERGGVLVASGEQGSPWVCRALNATGVVRASVLWFNTEKDIRRFGAALADVVGA